MFTKAGIIELHSRIHERLDLLLRHVATLPDELRHEPISGFGHPTVWKQVVHILTCEEGWVHDLQRKSFAVWYAEDCSTMAAFGAPVPTSIVVLNKPATKASPSGIVMKNNDFR